jgi:hypothetical protein
MYEYFIAMINGENQNYVFNIELHQMVLIRVARGYIFKPKNPNLGKFCRVLQWKMLVYLVYSWPILLIFAILCVHLVNFVVIWNIFSRFGMLYQEKSGNPGFDLSAGFVAEARRRDERRSGAVDVRQHRLHQRRQVLGPASRGRLGKKAQASHAFDFCRVVRWLVFKPKIPIWEKVSGPQIGKC